MKALHVYPRLRPGPVADVIRARGKDVAAVVFFRRVVIMWDRKETSPTRRPGER